MNSRIRTCEIIGFPWYKVFENASSIYLLSKTVDKKSRNSYSIFNEFNQIIVGILDYAAYS